MGMADAMPENGTFLANLAYFRHDDISLDLGLSRIYTIKSPSRQIHAASRGLTRGSKKRNLLMRSA
jgi:hypothetical protein